MHILFCKNLEVQMSSRQNTIRLDESRIHLHYLSFEVTWIRQNLPSNATSEDCWLPAVTPLRQIDLDLESLGHHACAKENEINIIWLSNISILVINIDLELRGKWFTGFIQKKGEIKTFVGKYVPLQIFCIRGFCMFHFVMGLTNTNISKY